TSPELAPEIPSVVLAGLEVSLSAAPLVVRLPTWPVVPSQFGAAFAAGPHSQKSTVPVASSGFVAPVTVTVAVSCTGVPGWMVPFVLTPFPSLTCVDADGEQRWKVPRSLSCSSESPDAEARLLTRKLEKHAPPSPSPVRLRPPSKRVE